MTKKYKVLITNDDGITASGIQHLYNAVKDIPGLDVYVVAPKEEQSGMASGITTRRPLHIEQIKDKFWSVDGTTVDCVKLAISVVLKCKPDLVLSGINAGSNAGKSIFYSGTVGGVIEAALHKIPGIAFSCQDIENPNFTGTEIAVKKVLKFVIKKPLNPGSFLNVTFPKDMENLRGIRIASQGKSMWADDPYLKNTTYSGAEYWLGRQYDYQQEEKFSDVKLVEDGFIAVCPISINNLTDISYTVSISLNDMYLQ